MFEHTLEQPARIDRSVKGEAVVTFGEIAMALRRRRRGIMVATVLSFAVVFAYHFLRTPEYRAVSIMMISNDYRGQGDLFSKVVGPEQDMVEQNASVKKDAELLKSITVSEMAVRELVRSGRSRSLELFGTRPYLSPLARALGPVVPTM